MQKWRYRSNQRVTLNAYLTFIRKEFVFIISETIGDRKLGKKENCMDMVEVAKLRRSNNFLISREQ